MPKNTSIGNKTPCEILNVPFTKTEMMNIIDNLKNNKAQSYDSISNEMMKNAPSDILDILIDFINLCLDKSLVPESFCKEIIIPIFKDGSKNDPNNYRDICISSVLTKIMTSMINNRMQSNVNKLNLVSKNQIGFKKGCRTADHLLTPKTIVKKYITKKGDKLYTCFVDFQKAFDSV